jgi:hypothetical protein
MKSAPVEVEIVPAETALAPAAPKVPGEVTGSVARLRQYASACEAMSRASVAMQVMAGFELLSLKKASPYTHGGNRKTPKPVSSTQNASLIEDTYSGCHSWNEFVAITCGISHDRARRWMAMAEACKPRLKRLDGFQALISEILSKPITDLTQDETTLLKDAVGKISDGRTQLDFLVELGLVKRPGNPDLGGVTPRGAKSGTPTDEIIRQMAREEWVAAARALSSYTVQFTTLPDSEVEAQISLLEAALAGRREWLRLKPAERTADRVGALKRRHFGV